jgi:DNA-nicking Smr family endonuclease
MTRRPRKPTSEELDLWERVAVTVAPLARMRTAPTAPAAEMADKAPPKPRAKSPPAALPVFPPRPPEPRKPPALATMDKRARSRVSRGVIAIDRRIDLHGLTQAAAEARLRRFLREAQEDGAKVVLVITGKGSEGDERGVLRRMAPHWLSSPAMRDVVVGFEEAARGHGGSGALYVRIRRVR